MNRTRQLKNTTLTLAVGFSLAGCTGNTQTDYGMQGCGVMGTIAGAATYLWTGDTKKAARAAGVACIGGALVGIYVADRKDKYASQEQAIAEETAWNEDFTKTVRATNDKLRQDIDGYRKQIASLKAALEEGQDTQAQLQDQKQAMQKHQAETKKVLDQVQVELKKSEEQYQTYQAGADPAKIKKWKTQIATLEREKQALNENLDELIAMSASI